MVINDILNKAKNVLIIGHINPDGDCIGSGLAVYYTAQKLGINADFVCDSPLPMHYSFMNGYDTINNPKHSNYDTVIALDCGDENRMGRYLEQFKLAKTSVNIDHHMSNKNYGKLNLVDINASSTCEIVGNLLLNEQMLDKTSAEYIFTGLSTDTGNFIHNTTNERVFLLAAKLCTYGIDNYFITRNLYRSNTIQKTKLIARAINLMRFFEDNRVCIVPLVQEDLDACGCKMNDTENIIDYAIGIRDVEVAAVITEKGKNSYKVSFRSKSISIVGAANSFGGGGHKLAAGCMVMGKLEDVVAKVKKSLSDCL